MRIFTAFLATETNTYSPTPTGWSDFEEHGLDRHGKAGDAKAAAKAQFFYEPIQACAAQEGHELVVGLTAYAQPSGRTLDSVYEGLRDRLLDDLKAAMPVDAVLLMLHGAMAAQSHDDCEGDLLQRIRELVGSKVAVGAELDLHCHYTEKMRHGADVIIACKEYPHTDFPERARELYRIVMDAAAGTIKPVTAVHDTRMIGVWPTTREPLAGFVRRMQQLEGKDGVLSISLGHGFPWADVADVGAKLWVTTDNDPRKAESLAHQLGQEFWAMRDQIGSQFLSPQAALARAAQVQGLAVISDYADNAGGGASSDSTFILRAMIEAGLREGAMGMFWDLGAVHQCRSAGVGATLDLRLGGKCGPTSGDPLDLRVTVRNIVDDFHQEMAGVRSPVGTAVWVRTSQGLDLVPNTQRTQVFSPGVFTGLGIELKRLVVVKSSNHFLAGFNPIASEVMFVTTPGTLRQDFEAIPYTKRDGNYWPRVQNPHARAQ